MGWLGWAGRVVVQLIVSYVKKTHGKTHMMFDLKVRRAEQSRADTHHTLTHHG